MMVHSRAGDTVSSFSFELILVFLRANLATRQELEVPFFVGESPSGPPYLRADGRLESIPRNPMDPGPQATGSSLGLRPVPPPPFPFFLSPRFPKTNATRMGQARVPHQRHPTSDLGEGLHFVLDREWHVAIKPCAIPMQ